MIPAPLPDDEYDRLAELHDLRLLDTGPEARFDRITRLAHRTFGLSTVAFTLVDEDRQQVKSGLGYELGDVPREQSFCAHAILDSGVMVVDDARTDPRFHDNPLVQGDPKIAFYAGAPVRTESGHPLGTLCVFDSDQRPWSEADSAALADFAAMVEREIGNSRQLARQHALVALTSISALTSKDPIDLLRQALRIAADYLEMPVGTVTLWTPAGSVVLARAGEDPEIVEGGLMPQRMSATSPFRDHDDVIALSRRASGPLSQHPLITERGFHDVIGIRLTVGGRAYGTLAFTTRTPLSYGEFSDEEIDFVRLLARWAEGALTRWEQEKRLEEKRSLLTLISTAQSEFISTSDRAQAFDTLLTDILAQTGCEFGFITERLAFDDGRPYLRTRAVSNIAWNEETRLLYEREHKRGLVFDNPNTLFGVTMMTGEPVIANDPETDPRANGRPGGHPPLNSYMGLPLELGTDFVGVLGLANRPGGFTSGLADDLLPLTTTLAQLIRAVQVQEERRADQQAIRRLSTVVAQMHSGVLVTDLDARIEWANDAFARITGHDPADLVGMRPRDVLHGAATDSAEETRIFESVQRQEPFAAELQVHRVDGEPFWVAIQSTLLREGDEPYGYVVLVDDISERKRVERMKTEFISTISHELRTPLTSISGSLGLVASGVAGELPARAQRMITIAQENSSRLATLINDLLDLERLAEGGLPIEAERHPLLDLVTRSVVDNQSYAARFNVTYAVQDHTREAYVHVDGLRFIQVMSNLLSNAAKFSPEGGQVVVRTSMADGTAFVEVIDSGSGIPEEFRAHIFDRFAQADSSDTRQRGGSGLGLAISRELIERMDGEIGYRPNPQGGSVFWFRLPLVAGRRRPRVPSSVTEQAPTTGESDG